MKDAGEYWQRKSVELKSGNSWKIAWRRNNRMQQLLHYVHIMFKMSNSFNYSPLVACPMIIQQEHLQMTVSKKTAS